MPRSRRDETVSQEELDPVVRWLKLLIEKNSLTQNDFANRIGVSTTYVNMLLQKKRKPSLGLLKRVADAFSDTSTLQTLLPRAYGLSQQRRRVNNSPHSLVGSTTLLSLFEMMNLQPFASTGMFRVECIGDAGLEPWGIRGNSYCLSEMVDEKDLLPGDLVVHGPEEDRQWGFVHSTGSEVYVISGGYHLKSLLRLTEQQWSESGLNHLDVTQYLLKSYFSGSRVNKVRLIFGPIPNLRTPLFTHPRYQKLKPVDREITDQVITRFTDYARGITGYQPSQD